MIKQKCPQESRDSQKWEIVNVLHYIRVKPEMEIWLLIVMRSSQKTHTKQAWF